MLSDDSRVVPFVPAGVTTTNQSFLEFLFGDQWPQVLVTSFKRDPADTTQPREDWNAWLAGKVLNNPKFDEGNTYFCPSLLVPETRGTASLRQDRTIDNFKSLHVIIIDDIPTKIKFVEVVNLLRIPPSYVIETSPGNHQAGWKIEPETNLAWVKGMLSQLDRTLGGADNLTNPVAWRRLPVGWNTKQSLGLGPRGFRIRLKAGYPGPMIRGLDWPSDIEPMIGVVIPLTTLDRGTGDGARPDDAVLAHDPIYRALEAAGHIVGNRLTSDKYWAATIKCPWIAHHGPTRPLTGAEYVPAIAGQRGWFHCFHCERRNQAEFKEQLDVVLRDEGAKIVAAFEFDEIDPAAILLGPASGPRGEAIDLWDRKTPPTWPGGILPAPLEDTIQELAERDGLDLGALGASMITAASGAADKRATLTPYIGSNWRVLPVLWLMLIAEPGQRKTAILGHLLGRLRKVNAERMRAHTRDVSLWRALTPQQKHQLPAPTVRALLAEDTTIEKLQEWMAENPRGLLYLRDELASLFEFGRYTTGTGAAERANFLEFYEGGPTTIGRIARTTTIDNCALSIIGGIQPHRLAGFKNLTDDGFLSRFGTLIMQPHVNNQGVFTKAPDLSPITSTIERLLVLGPDAYHTDQAGEDVIRDLENTGDKFSQRPDAGAGYRGFMSKLHGTLARTALILHMIDGGQDQLVPHDTVLRAARYAVFLLDHAEVFYAGLSGSADNVARAIGSYLLRHPTDRVTAGRLRSDVAACRQMASLKEIQDAVFLLVIGGWLAPETNYPTNNSWRVRPGLRDQFAARKALETGRVNEIKQAMNQHGKYRD